MLCLIHVHQKSKTRPEREPRVPVKSGKYMVIYANVLAVKANSFALWQFLHC